MSGPRLGVLVPCRNEAAVIERKLANLAALRWPDGEHRIVVVDDDSHDATRELAERFLAAHAVAGVRANVVTNDHGAGKGGAMASGLAELEQHIDLVVLTDADVVLQAGALVELADAFANEPELLVACGAQEFVRDLASDGSCRGQDRGPAVRAAGLYDRISARVRALESRFGKLFSVHGQLMAWRAGRGLVPPCGQVADDIELGMQARALGGLVRLVPRARFLEVKTPIETKPGSQSMRRAQGYFKVLKGRRAPLGGSPVDALQWWLYRVVPAVAAEITTVVVLVGLALAWHLGGVAVGLAVTLALLLAFVSPVGRRFARLLLVIRRARRSVSESGISDRWEMQRT